MIPYSKELADKITYDARECLEALKHLDDRELKDGHSGHKVGQMRPMLLVKDLLNKLIETNNDNIY